jgi:hypothetical protein
MKPSNMLKDMSLPSPLNEMQLRPGLSRYQQCLKYNRCEVFQAYLSL